MIDDIAAQTHADSIRTAIENLKSSIRKAECLGLKVAIVVTDGYMDKAMVDADAEFDVTIWYEKTMKKEY